jgi:hypothetical protein
VKKSREARQKRPKCPSLAVGGIDSSSGKNNTVLDEIVERPVVVLKLSAPGVVITADQLTLVPSPSTLSETSSFPSQNAPPDRYVE